MPLPRGDEYNQAVQNPALSFADSDLKRCQVETTPLGLPKPYSGGFTTTYKLSNMGKNWAARCFTREIKDLQQRYKSISSFLSKNSCSFLVDAQYLQNGIKISGSFYPIIKMNWLEGDSLNAYIDKIYNQRASLENLLNEFVSLVSNLETFGIAHGDLQHGNIIVKNGKLFLIDYDGMYLPDLANLSVNELGHPNFQHPRRTAKDYNKHIDRFSSIVIYTAIKAIITKPNLWQKYENGDNLLFKGSDFANPNNSTLLKEFEGYSELARLANNISAICTLEFNRIPSLQEFIGGKIASSTQVLPKVTTVRSAYLVLDGSQRGQILEHIGERVEVIGKIGDSKSGSTKNGYPYLFVNFGSFPNQTFTIVLWSEVLILLKKSGIEATSLRGKYVSITGVLNVYHSEYRGLVTSRPQITLEIPSQLQILEDESAAKAKLNYHTVSTPLNVKSNPLPKTVKEEDFWDSYLANKPITPKPIAQLTVKPIAQPTVKPTTQPVKAATTSAPLYTNSNITNSKSGSSSSAKKPSGCLVIVILAIVCAFIFGSITQSGGGALLGIFVGGVISLFLIDDF